MYLRNHRFRASETDSAQRYPLCKYCLGRVRSTCDFVGFLRMVKDGHWRADGEDSEKAAWEESVRLRDQMFWARIGGGVVPISQLSPGGDGQKSRRVSRLFNEETSEATTTEKSAKAVEHTGSKTSTSQQHLTSAYQLTRDKDLPQTPPEQISQPVTYSASPILDDIQEADKSEVRTSSSEMPGNFPE